MSLPAPAYSYRYFAGAVNTTAEVPLGVVPAGHRFIVNYASFTPTGTAPGDLLFYLMPGRLEVTRLHGTTVVVPVYWSGRVVLHEGEYAQLRAVSLNWVGSVHGFLLTGSGGPTFPSTLPGS